MKISFFGRGGKEARAGVLSQDLGIVRVTLTRGERKLAWGIERESEILEYSVVLPYQSEAGNVICPGMSDYEDSVRVEEGRLNEKYSEQEKVYVLRKPEIKGTGPETGKYVLGENTALVVVRRV